MDAIEAHRTHSFAPPYNFELEARTYSVVDVIRDVHSVFPINAESVKMDFHPEKLQNNNSMTLVYLSLVGSVYSPAWH